MLLNFVLILLTIGALGIAFWQYSARNRPLLAVFGLAGPARIEGKLYSGMKVTLRNWGGVPALNTVVTMDVIATSHTKPRKTMNCVRKVDGPIYPGQDFAIQPDFNFRELLKDGYRFRLVSKVQCSSLVPTIAKQLNLMRLLSHTQTQVWDWQDNQWKLMGSELNNLQPAAE